MAAHGVQLLAAGAAAWFFLLLFFVFVLLGLWLVRMIKGSHSMYAKGEESLV